MEKKTGFWISRWIALFLAVMFIIPTGNVLATGAAGERDILIVQGNASPMQTEPGHSITFTASAEFGKVTVGMSDVTSSTSFVWFFGDGSLVKGQSLTHKYSSSGTYTVTVTGSYGSYTDKDSLTITIRVLPVAKITADTTSPKAYLDSVHFDASGPYDPDGYVTSYKWDFGDGSTASGVTADHTFKEGTYAVKLTVTDNGGFSDTTTVTINSNLPKYRITDASGNSTTPKVYYHESALKVFWIENGTSVMMAGSDDFGWTWSSASEIFTTPSLAITDIDMASDGANVAIAIECAPSVSFPDFYILYSNDGGDSWLSPYKLSGDNPSVDIIGNEIYLAYREWSGLGTPDFYLGIVITYNVDGTFCTHALANPSGGAEFTGVPEISVIMVGSVRHIYVTVADYVTKNVYFWESLNGGTAWSNPEVIAELTEVGGNYMDLRVSPQGLYFIWSNNRMGNYELWFKVYREGSWSENLLLTNALGDSFEPVTRIDSDSYVHVLWSDFRDCNYEIYETVLDYNGNTVKNDSRVTTTNGDSEYPDMVIDSQSKTALTQEYYTFEVWQDNSEGNYEIYFKNNIVDGYIGQTTASLTSTVQTAQNYISSLPDDYFSNTNLRKPLINKYEVVGNLLENGIYWAAANKIKYDITPKMDGFEGGNPRNDWIIADTAQEYLGGVNEILVLQPGGPPGEPPFVPPISPPGWGKPIELPPPLPSPPPPPSQPSPPSTPRPRPEISAVLVVPAESSISISWDVDWPNIIDDPTFVSSATLNGQTISYDYQAGSYYVEFSGLTPDTTYSFTIYAGETSGGITYSDTYTSSATTESHVLQLTFGPTVTATTNGGFSSAVIEWGTNNAASSILQYRESGTSPWTEIITDTGAEMRTSHHIKISGLKPDTSYEYIASSENPAYSEESQASGTFSTPNTINDLTVSPTFKEAEFIWHTDTAMDTEVYYKLPWDTEWTAVTIWGFTTEHTVTITGLQPSTIYDYYVRSRNNPSSDTDLIVISSPSTFTTDAFFSRIEASDYYEIDDNGNIIEGTIVSWTTSEPTINNLVKYTTNADTAESTWSVIQDTKDSVRSHYVLIEFTTSKDYTYRVHSTLSDKSKTLVGPTKHFTALPDLDGDGLHDAEEDYGWYVTATVEGGSEETYHVVSLRKSANSDVIDGLTDKEEKAAGTDPFKFDTDKDGLMDGWYDLDQDEVYDVGEAKGEIGDASSGNGGYGTNACVWDSDGDKLNDSLEIKGWLSSINNVNIFLTSNPLSSDSDGDMLSDNLEYLYGTNPFIDDSDGDGISDYMEIQPRDAGGYVWIDFNNDSLVNESAEIFSVSRLISLMDGKINERLVTAFNDGHITAQQLSDLVYNASHDFDGDGHPDRLWAFDDGHSEYLPDTKMVTSPILNDTDGDGYRNGYELLVGSNPFIDEREWKSLYYVKATADLTTELICDKLPSISISVGLYFDGADILGETIDGKDGWITTYLVLGVDSMIGTNLLEFSDLKNSGQPSVGSISFETGTVPIRTEYGINEDKPYSSETLHILAFDFEQGHGVKFSRIGLTVGYGSEFSVLQADINYKAIANKLIQNGQDVGEAISNYGSELVNSSDCSTPLYLPDPCPLKWMIPAFDVINEILSGVYDTATFGLSILESIFYVSEKGHRSEASPMAPSFVRGIYMG